MLSKQVARAPLLDVMSGEKTREGRFIRADTWNANLVGKLVKFHDGKTLETSEYTQVVKITGVTMYPGDTLEDAIRLMLVSEGVARMLPYIDRDPEISPEVKMELAASLYLMWNVAHITASPAQMGAFQIELVN